MNSLPLLDLQEKERLEKMRAYEKEGYAKGFRLIAGIDEAGRGPLAGPVVAAACILPFDFHLPTLNDSKLLTPQKRKKLFEAITNDPSILFGIGIVSHEEIDQINIYEATKVAMQRALDQLSESPDYLLVDGMPLFYKGLPSLKIVKGDQLSLSIAAASVVAKERRDALMEEYHLEWPDYGFDRHKGYGTRQHLKALEAIGPCPIHRRSFEPIKSRFCKRF